MAPRLDVRSFLLFFILVLLLAVPISAKGGSSSSSTSSGSTSSGGSSSAGDTFLSSLKCNDKGSISFNQKPPIKPVVLHLDGKELNNIEGAWEGSQFTSEEAVVVQPGTYTVADPKNGNQSVDCPGLKFSCRLVSLNLEQCTSNEGLEVSFRLGEADVDDLKFQFQLDGKRRTLSYTKNSASMELADATISSEKGGLYTFSAANVPKILSVQVSHPECVGRYYIYSKMDCKEGQAKPAEGVPGNKMKCGGYMDIEDRVRCRLDLFSNEEDEFENFFPEECFSHEDQDACIGLYQNVASCWDEVRCHMRTSCLKQKVGLNLQISCTNELCRQERRTKILTYIKLLFYNLQEQGEMLEEKGVLSKEDLVPFIVFTEGKKLEFNKASSRDEYQRIILEVRAEWKSLMLKVS